MNNEINIERLDYYCWLEELRRGGKINMYESVPMLAEEFGISMSYAKDVVIDWMSNYKNITKYIKQSGLLKEEEYE